MKLNMKKVGFPSDTQYFNFGIAKQVRRNAKIFAVFSSLILLCLGLSVIIFLYKVLQNKDVLFKRTEECSSTWKEFEGYKQDFMDSARKEYQLLQTGGKGYGLSMKLIAYDLATLQRLNGVFACFCAFYKD